MAKQIDSDGFGLKPKPAQRAQKELTAVVAAPNTAPKQGSRRRKRGEGENFERLTVYLPDDMAKKLRHYCVDARCSASDAITRALAPLVGG